MKMDRSLLSGSTALLVLSLLQETDKYGYQIIQDLTIRSQNVFALKEGTLYPVLHGLEKEGCLKSYEKTAPTGRVRKYYGITPKGKERLAEKQAQWTKFSAAVDHVINFA